MPFDLTQPDQASYYRSGYYRGYFALGPLPDLSQITEEYRQATQLGFVGGTQKTKPLISVDLTPPQSKPAASPEKDPGETAKRLNQPGDNRVKPDTQEAMAWYRRGFEGDSATPPKVYAGWYAAGTRDRQKGEVSRVPRSPDELPGWAGPAMGIGVSLILAAGVAFVITRKGKGSRRAAY